MNTWKKSLTLPLMAGLVLGVLAVWNPNEAKQPEAPARLLRHVVMFKFKDDATEAQVQGIEKAFAALPSKIDAIHSYEWGKNNSPENLNKGLTHCFLVTFKDEKGRDAYLPHAAHQEFVAQLKPILDDVCVIDYWTE
ncbi:MAG: Dabb family protein [Planctomycetaceae bacterium]